VNDRGTLGVDELVEYARLGFRSFEPGPSGIHATLYRDICRGTVNVFEDEADCAEQGHHGDPPRPLKPRVRASFIVGERMFAIGQGQSCARHRHHAPPFSLAIPSFATDFCSSATPGLFGRPAGVDGGDHGFATVITMETIDTINEITAIQIACMCFFASSRIPATIAARNGKFTQCFSFPTASEKRGTAVLPSL
jgi:hypothetical protein